MNDTRRASLACLGDKYCKLYRLIAGLVLALLHAWSPASAGDLTKADIERRFGPPLHVQEKLADIPAWPLTSELEPDAGPVAYVFESIDLAPVPGFEGSPINLLVSIDRKGNFMDVELLRQHEPVFLSGLGEAPLREFLTQYSGHNLKEQFLIALNAARNRTGPANNRAGQTTLDGVSKATASIRIVNQSVLGAALAVARARLGFAPKTEHGPPAMADSDQFTPMSFQALLDEGYIGRVTLLNRDIEERFRGSDGEGVDAEALARPDDTFLDLYIAYLNTPTIGRNLLGDARYAAVMKRNFDNRHLWWIGSRGRYPMIETDYTPGAASARLSMAQDGLFLELRDQGLEFQPMAALPDLNASLIFGVFAEAGLDPARALDLTLTVTRAKGQILPLLSYQAVSLRYQPPARLFIFPPEPTPEWLLAWQNRWLDLLILGISMTLLATVLARPKWLTVDARRLNIFRTGFLLFTLVYLGWYAQGQLSIVQVTGAIKALRAGQGLGSYLYDPITLLVIAFTLISFFIWGRGTFCGWLCPFGAMQEFVGKLAQRLGLRQLKLAETRAKKLEHLRYLVLVILLLAAWLAPQWGERLNEVEPFKTAITVGFDRTWPYVGYALLLLAVGAVYYKAFCRFLCPLGGVMSLGGRLRIFNWLPRRAECGKPCQTCKSVCEYDAIEPDGRIRYDGCFQCLDCVGIYHDDKRCAPLIYHARTGKTWQTGGRNEKTTTNT